MTLNHPLTFAALGMPRQDSEGVLVVLPGRAPGRGAELCFGGRWRAAELIRSVPPEVLPQLRAKVAAMELLKGHRADIGLQRAWQGNYIALVSEGTWAQGAQRGKFGKMSVGFVGGEVLGNFLCLCGLKTLTPTALGVIFVNAEHYQQH